MKQIWIYDIEQYRNFHCVTFQARDDETNIQQFVICELQNDYKEYKEFLNTQVAGLIGFNNLSYDGTILTALYGLGKINDPNKTNEYLFALSNDIINERDTDHIKRLRRYRKFEELDLFKILHLDSNAKKTSLKTVGIALKHDNIQDLPYTPDSTINSLNELKEVLKYNLNDVVITRKLFEATIDEINMRMLFQDKFGINVINANDPQIGSKLIAKYLSDALDISSYELSRMRTYRPFIKLEDIILSYIKFNTKEFNQVLQQFKETILTETKNTFDDFSVVINQVKYVFGTGGIHGAQESGIYNTTDNESIIHLDASSFYPNIAIQNKFYPEHLTEKFCIVYNEIYQERLKAKKEKDKTADAGYKLSLNAVFGKSNDKYSFFYDPAFTMKITVNGQLLLAMLTESLILADIEIIQVNTDGIIIRCNNDKIDEIKRLCNEWERLTHLSLDYDYFKKIIQRDVNSYINVYQDITKNTKQKGVFLIERALYKDHSMKVVRIAVHDYFVHDIAIEDTIKRHKDIYDFCFRHKSTKGWKAEVHYIKDNEEQIDYLSKNVRFFVSDTGSTLYKVHKDGRRIGILVGKTVTIFNQYFEKPMKEYNIDYNYYISEAYRIVYMVTDGQLKLF